MSTDRKYVVFAPLTTEDLDALRDYCRRKQRTTEHVVGDIVHSWLQTAGLAPLSGRAGEAPPEVSGGSR